MAAVSGTSPPTILEKSLLSSANSGCKNRENTASSVQKTAESSNKNCRTQSPGSTAETAAPVLQHRNDDELTSLTWLQDSNLLFGTALSQMKVINSSEKRTTPVVNGIKPISTKMDEVKPKPVEVAEPPEIESPTSELSEDQEPRDSKEAEDEIIESVQSTSPDQFPVPYNPQVHVKSKPPYSFSSLIFMAIEDSVEKALPVKDIYSWVIRHFPYYRGAPTGWKNSVRHNLSLNKCFRKVDKSPTLGKGSLWMVDPAYRPNLLQTLNKTPYPSTNRNDHMYVTSAKNAMSRNPLDHLNRLKEGTPLYPENPKEVQLHLTNMKQYENGHPVSEATSRISLPSESYINLALQERPMLLKQVHKDDVDAAAAMLVLKHGPMILQDNPQFTIKNANWHGSSVSNGYCGTRKRKQFHTELQDPNCVLINSNLSLDHSYVSAMDDYQNGNDTVAKRQKMLSKGNIGLSSSSGIEPKREGEAEKSVPLYEANALLKLASIATSLASTDIHQNMTYFNGSVTDSDILPSDAAKLNETNSRKTSHSSAIDGSTPLKSTNRKKKNLHPVKRILNNEIKKIYNNNSCSALNKNDLSRLDYRV